MFPELRPEAAQWEDFEGFRETFLVHFADPEHKVALRRLGQLLYALILEAPYPPPQPEGEGAWVRSHLGAALADLRFLQGFLGFVGQEGGDGGSARELTLLCQAAGRISRAVGREAERLEGALGQGGL
ncbi:MAG TPA: hypothetical protein DD490_00595 [Acidobacteria bacterium]|nr:hypothetical protein [Acidobacteriota bacterium]